jgi:hypothetical protein
LGVTTPAVPSAAVPRVLHCLGLVALFALVRLVPTPAAYGAAALVAGAVGVRLLSGPWLLWALLDLQMLAAVWGESPYRGTADLGTVLPLQLAVLALALGWALTGLRGPQREEDPQARRIETSGLCFRVAVAAAVVAALADLLRYRAGGAPLLSPDVDAARAALGEQSNVLVGLAREGWTVAFLVSMCLLVAARRKRYVVLAVVSVVAVGLGASRNGVLSLLVPGLLVLATGARPDLRRLSGRQWVLTATAAVLGVGAVGWFAGARILQGSGSFERVFQQRYAGEPLRVTWAAIQLSLSAPVETWARLDSVLGTLGAPGPFVLQSVRSLLEPFGRSPDLYAVTGSLSQPFFMNTATVYAAPELDLGRVGGALFLLAVGLGLGLVSSWSARQHTPFARALGCYWLYVGVFSGYEFLPFVYLSWVPATVVLVLLHGSEVRARGHGHAGNRRRRYLPLREWSAAGDRPAR